MGVFVHIRLILVLSHDALEFSVDQRVGCVMIVNSGSYVKTHPAKFNPGSFVAINLLMMPDRL